MINETQLHRYIESIPPLPDILEKVQETLKRGDMPQAGRLAGKDPALTHYFQNIIRKPYFGLSDDLEDMVQIFGALGILQVERLLKSYLLTLICPEEWSFFRFDQMHFRNLQVDMMSDTEKIMSDQGLTEEDNYLAAVLLPSTLIVCEGLFADHRQDVLMLREVKNLTYNTILHRLSGMDFYDIAVLIGKKWGFSDKTLRIVRLISGSISGEQVNEEELLMARYLHLLLFYHLSKKSCLQAGMNELTDLHPEFVEPVQENFLKIVGGLE